MAKFKRVLTAKQLKEKIHIQIECVGCKRSKAKSVNILRGITYGKTV